MIWLPYYGNLKFQSLNIKNPKPYRSLSKFLKGTLGIPSYGNPARAQLMHTPLKTYLWLVGNGGMGYNYNCYYYHSSIPY